MRTIISGGEGGGSVERSDRGVKPLRHPTPSHNVNYKERYASQAHRIANPDSFSSKIYIYWKELKLTGLATPKFPLRYVLTINFVHKQTALHVDEKNAFPIHAIFF